MNGSLSDCDFGGTPPDAGKQRREEEARSRQAAPPDAPGSLSAARSWEKQEAGWYTSDIGGICREHDGWAFWPNDFSWPTLRKLPTLGAAIAEAHRLARTKGSG